MTSPGPSAPVPPARSGTSWTDLGPRVLSAAVIVVVIATGLYQTPKVPKFGSALPANIRQVHSDAYRKPEELLPGAVLVVGSAQSGNQIAEELYESR